MKVTLTMNEKQAAVLMKALDLHSRLRFGQMHFLDDIYLDKKYDADAVREHLEAIKDIIFPEIRGSTAHSTRRYEPDPGQISWDIYQVLRHGLAWHQHPEGGGGMSFADPLPASDEPLPEIKIEGGE